MEQPTKYYYLIKVQYLGFRYHGWQIQPGVKTLQKMLEKTFAFVLKHQQFKILGSGRTDAMVSANEAAFELFINHSVNCEQLLQRINKSLPNDILLLSIESVAADFNIIQHSKTKEYRYLFSFGNKNHPYCAPFICGYPEQLDVELMKKGAKLFEGEHNFMNYAYKPKENTRFVRTIQKSEIVENTELTASFFPEKSFYFCIEGDGFMRYQVRLMMGILYLLGKGEIDLSFVSDTLNYPGKFDLKELAPASGLALYKIEFQV